MITRIQFTALALLAASLAACTTSSSGSGRGPGGNGAGGGAAGTESARFFLPTGEPTNTAAPTLTLDANDGIHAVYPAYVRRRRLLRVLRRVVHRPRRREGRPLRDRGHRAQRDARARRERQAARAALDGAARLLRDVRRRAAPSRARGRRRIIRPRRRARGHGQGLRARPRGPPALRDAHVQGVPRRRAEDAGDVLGLVRRRAATMPGGWSASKISEQMWRVDDARVRRRRAARTSRPSRTSTATEYSVRPGDGRVRACARPTADARTRGSARRSTSRSSPISTPSASTPRSRSRSRRPATPRIVVLGSSRRR